MLSTPTNDTTMTTTWHRKRTTHGNNPLGHGALYGLLRASGLACELYVTSQMARPMF